MTPEAPESAHRSAPGRPGPADRVRGWAGVVARLVLGGVLHARRDPTALSVDRQLAGEGAR
ncbi:hypothetical protein [Ornithinicoccus halotolerans]|uniref:hypothetical protein n=1 Tax=Ornithinicoccus halotolerans TaxID=1748220 RepID=UPI001294E728|nr:hypothetical protein [Ornithinicoccus halotolerans]